MPNKERSFRDGRAAHRDELVIKLRVHDQEGRTLWWLVDWPEAVATHSNTGLASTGVISEWSTDREEERVAINHTDCSWGPREQE